MMIEEDPHDQCRRREHRLQEILWQTTGRVARVELVEGDGGVVRMLQILDVYPTSEGLLVRVR